ncbi:MAG: hypothetical protein KAS32_04590 [Candidatus Peribacteraceae bacterium]|nr:hypothetical protein [Candidatus Peribacteraceae bacterium]
MRHSALIDDLYTALRRCIIKGIGASQQQRKLLHAEHAALQEQLTAKEAELSVLNWIYDPENVIDRPKTVLG